MEKILLVFDRMKQAFNVNVQNKKIYGIQIMLALISTITTAAFFGILYSYYLQLESSGFNLAILKFNDLISTLTTMFLIFIALLIVLIIFEAGLYHMYFRAVYSGTANNIDFAIGIRKYFTKFFWINFLTTIFWIVSVPLYLIAGLFTLGAGFIVIPIIITAFLSMWKVSLVVDGCGMFSALRNSFRFAGRNFVPYIFFILLMLAFTAPVRQNNFGNVISSIQDLTEKNKQKQDNNKLPNTLEKSITESKDTNYLEELNNQPDLDVEKQLSDILKGNKIEDEIEASNNPIKMDDAKKLMDEATLDQLPKLFEEDFMNNVPPVFKEASGAIKIILIIFISVIVVGVFLSSFIKMFFQVFFMLAMFVIYKKGFTKEVVESGEVMQS